MPDLSPLDATENIPSGAPEVNREITEEKEVNLMPLGLTCDWSAPGEHNDPDYIVSTTRR